MDNTLSDVVILGAGPAGSTAATALARAGHGVVVIERETFPRPKIGESLLPVALPVLETLGIDLSAGPHQFKAGARFLDEATGDRRIYPFADTLPGSPDHAFQVERARFDSLLADTARDAGAEVRMGCAAHRIALTGGGVEVEADGGTVRARYLIDASGQRAIMARQRRALRPLKLFGRAAAYTHLGALPQEPWEREIAPQGNVEIFRVPAGWMWAIPLHGRRLSVGLVTAEGAIRPGDVLAAIEASPTLSRWTAGAHHTEPGLVGDFSFYNTAAFGPRYACLGDSACFLDPVYSSGVALALLGALRGAQIIDAGLRAGREAAGDLMAEHAAHMHHGYRAFFVLIYRFYHTGLLENLFFSRDPDPIMRRGLITMLAGDVWRDDNPFQRLLLHSSRVAVDDHLPPSCAAAGAD